LLNIRINQLINLNLLQWTKYSWRRLRLLDTLRRRRRRSTKNYYWQGHWKR